MSRRIVLVDIGNAMTLRGVLPSVAVDASYNARVTASGGAAPYTYTITAGADALTAAGFQLDPATGVFSASSVSGAGNIPITVRATGINGAYVQRQFVVTVIAEPLVLTITGTYPAATVGAPYSADLVITNGVQPYSNARVTAGALPSWATLQIVGDKLRLSGTPDEADTTIDITVAVDDADGQTASSAQSIPVAAAGDPYWANVTSLLHCDGADLSTTFVDQKGLIWTASGTAKISTTEPKFGTGAGLFDASAGCWVDAPTGDGFAFGTGDFTIEAWVKIAILDGNRFVFGFGPNWGVYVLTPAAILFDGSGNRIVYQAPPGDPVPGTGAYTHFAVQRAAGVFTLFIDGFARGTYANSTDFTVGNFRLGAQTTGSGGWSGYLDDLRVTKGVARYSGDFTPPTMPYPNA